MRERSGLEKRRGRGGDGGEREFASFDENAFLVPRTLFLLFPSRTKLCVSFFSPKEKEDYNQLTWLRLTGTRIPGLANDRAPAAAPRP